MNTHARHLERIYSDEISCLFTCHFELDCRNRSSKALDDRKLDVRECACLQVWSRLVSFEGCMSWQVAGLYCSTDLSCSA